MTDLETLHALLDAAYLGEAKNDFTTGSLDWEIEQLFDLTEVRTSLKKQVEGGATGWILFADRVVEPAGVWKSEWRDDYPLEAELALPDGTFIRLTHMQGEWNFATASITGSTGILETTNHRRINGGMITHEVAWTGDPMRPVSAALHSTSKA